MLTMIHPNRARVEGGVLRIDRKFHVGMQEYVKKIHAPLLTIHPESDPGQSVMDMVNVPCDELGYSVATFKTDASSRPLPQESLRLREQISRSVLVYGGEFGVATMARDLGIPYIMILEYDLRTKIKIATTEVNAISRKVVRAARCVWNHAKVLRPDIRWASRVHCNGYPVYDEASRLNPGCLLYLDSRMSLDQVISEDDLERRLAGRSRQPLRLLYSGRFEPIKGAVDVVRVGLACLERGLDIELHCYGQGSSRTEMDRLASQSSAKGKIYVHDPVTYPELVKLARGFDAFVCCHVQSDPSCTYLETLGSGLPIVGYQNRMWSRLGAESRAGFWSPLYRPDEVVDDIHKLSVDHETLATMSRRARRFALDHGFENEFALRINDLNVHYAAANSRLRARMS